jgi:hypothetical protein
MEPDVRQSAMPNKTCKDFDYTGVKCCPICHESKFEMLPIKIDNGLAVLCCAFRAFFYPDDPGIGLTPEEKLLRAIFGESTVHSEEDMEDWERDRPMREWEEKHHDEL